MDLATIIGLLLGIGLVGSSVVDSLDLFVDVGSVFIVVGGGTAATMMSMPLKRMLGILGVMKNAFFVQKASTKDLITDLVRYGEIARRDGILALEGVMEEVKDAFLSKGIQLAVDGNDPDDIASTLQQEMDSLADRHGKGKGIFDLLGKYAPAFGMIGTLVGLILMLGNLDDPSMIAPSMAVALLTTLYGAILANLIAMPIADKLASSSEQELQRMTIVMEGVIAIQSGDNPKVVQQKLQMFLPPGDRIEE